MHSDLRLILLSRIDGDAPHAWKTVGSGVLEVREQADFNFRSRSLEHPNTGSFAATVHRSQSDSQLLFIPHRGKVHLYDNETLRRKSRVYDLQPGSARTFCTG